ncbi:MAG TPA: IclR family transcriptional regulator [Burkholderiaceae bacterium]|nr:IclR family transcriptional regulator [Burkholderiaceae bacterium]
MLFLPDPAGLTENDPNFVTALARGLALLRCYQPGDTLLGNREFVKRTGLPKATVNRLASTLVSLGYLRYDAALGKYGLDAGVLALGYAYLASSGLIALARPHMVAFAQQHGVSISLGKRDRLEMVYLESIRSHAGSSLVLGVGSRLSLLSSSMGRAYLAAMPELRREALLRDYAQAYPEQWAVEGETARRAIQTAAELGYAGSFREWHPAVHACAVAFRVAGEDDLYVMSCSASYQARSEADFDAQLAPALGAMVGRLGTLALR